MLTSQISKTLHSARCHRRGRVAQISWRYATAADVREFYGSPPAVTMKALVGLVDGVPGGIIGIAREEWTARFFADFTYELEPYLNTIVIMRGIKRAMAFVRDYPTAVYAVGSTERGCRALERLGFVATEQENGYIWQS